MVIQIANLELLPKGSTKSLLPKYGGPIGIGNRLQTDLVLVPFLQSIGEIEIVK